MTAKDIASQPSADWDEAQCTSALALLEGLQAQIDDLRLAMPRIIEPFHQPPSPGMFKLYAQGVIGSQNGIKDLHESWRSQEAQQLFEHTAKSLAGNPDLSASVSIPSYGWTERDKKEREEKKSSPSEVVEESTPALTAEDIAQILVEFNKTYPNIKLETQDDNHTISTQFVAEGNKLCFRVSIEREPNDMHKLVAICQGAREPFLGITRCIASRPQANDLKYLLDMIAAYKLVKGTSCAKCGKSLDSTMMKPIARRSKQVAITNESAENVWQALHENCT